MKQTYISSVSSDNLSKENICGWIINPLLMQKWREAPHFFLAELMLILWCFDRLFSIYCYRKLKGKVVLKMANNSYVIMLLKLNRRVNPGVGDTYYLLNEGDKQRRHPFTIFSHHND